jgi:chorismate mutase
MLYDIIADIRKNRLYITLEGSFNDDEASQVAKVAVEKAQKLRPGFDVITDISEFQPATFEGTKEVQAVQEMLVKLGVNRIIRVVGKSIIGQMQFRRTLKSIGLVAETAPTVEEAEKMLNQ